MTSIYPLLASELSSEEECPIVVSVTISVSLECTPIGEHECSPGSDVEKVEMEKV